MSFLNFADSNGSCTRKHRHYRKRYIHSALTRNTGLWPHSSYVNSNLRHIVQRASAFRQMSAPIVYPYDSPCTLDHSSLVSPLHTPNCLLPYYDHVQSDPVVSVYDRPTHEFGWHRIGYLEQLFIDHSTLDQNKHQHKTHKRNACFMFNKQRQSVFSGPEAHPLHQATHIAKPGNNLHLYVRWDPNRVARKTCFRPVCDTYSHGLRRCRDLQFGVSQEGVYDSVVSILDHYSVLNGDFGLAQSQHNVAAGQRFGATRCLENGDKIALHGCAYVVRLYDDNIFSY